MSAPSPVDSQELRVEALTPWRVHDLYAFFKHGLSQRSQYFFKPHPKCWGLAHLIYLAMWLKSKCDGSVYLLCYDDQALACDSSSVSRGRDVVGFYLLLPHPEGLLMGIAVSDQHQGRGLGSRIMKDLIARARSLSASKITLTHACDNKAAHALYEKFGFVDKGFQEVKSFFRPSRREVWMELDLDVGAEA